MKDSIPLVFCFVAACTTIVAQNPQYKNYSINNTGYYALFPADPGEAEVTISDDLMVYASEVEYNGNRYGLVMVLLDNNFVDSDRETLESLMASYLSFLKLSYDVTSSIGYIKGQNLISNPRAYGILDYWEDVEGAQWAVKAWIDNNALAVLYTCSEKAEVMPVPYEFLDGFVFKNIASKN